MYFVIFSSNAKGDIKGREILHQQLDELHFSDQDISDDEYRKFKQEEKFRTEVGQSGRFKSARSGRRVGA